MQQMLTYFDGAVYKRSLQEIEGNNMKKNNEVN